MPWYAEKPGGWDRQDRISGKVGKSWEMEKMGGEKWEGVSC